MGPSGGFIAPAFSQFAFGAGPFTHFESIAWVLETTAANNIRLRRTGFTGTAVSFGITHPTGCTGNPLTGTASAGQTQVHNITFTAGQTLTGTFCGEGSFTEVNIFDEATQDQYQFRCWRVSGNSNACRRTY
jgi:hypothetical protein